MASQISKTASSSSSSSMSPTSISKDEYDVFLSFSREDIGKSFADHLYAALVKKGLHPFREAIGKPESKEAISSESLMAIEKSKVFIVMFSKSYAQSRYNLDELVKIMECTQATRKVVVPVFYHVNPSDVRKQKRSYEEAFHDHDAKQEKEKIDNWRTALTEASKLKGYYHLDQDRYESTIIMQITDSVIDRLKHADIGDDNLVGIDSRLEELHSLIGIGFDDVRMLGVYGFGGIGVKDKNLNNVDEGINEIKKRLRQKKVLIIVDDVDHSSHLKYLVPDRDCLGKGSRIIITTRDKHLLCEYGVDAIYEVQELGSEESMLLFSLCAFKRRFPEKGYVELSREIVDYANGHPLTLKVLGHSLYEPGKWSRLWSSEDVHHVLTKNKGTNAVEGIFVNMPTSKPIEFTTEAFKMMNGLRLLKVHRDLKCGVVHVSTGFEFPSYELRYLHWDEYPLESLPLNFHGVNLIELNLQYGKLRVLWKVSKLHEKLKVINLSHSQQLIQIPDFSDTPNLESLILEGCTNLENLPSSIWDLDSLVNLDLSHCSNLQKLPEVQGNLYSLEYLNLAFCKKLESLPENLCNLKYLKTLNVIGCSKLGRLPESLGSLECLEKLCASNADLISSQFHYSLAGLCSLKILDAHGTCLTKGAISSDIGSLYSLEELDLSYCNLMDGGIPDDIFCLYSLRVLDLSGNHFRRVTDAISQLSKLRVLRLRHCKNLGEISELPSSLRVLDAHGCTSMKTLSSTSLSPWQRQLNCFKSAVLQEIQELKYSSLLSLPANGVSQGFSTFIPGSGEVPEWMSHQSVGSEVTAELPPNWYDNNEVLGFALCCVYIPQQDEPESSTSENAMVNITQPYHLRCKLTFLDGIGFLDDLLYGSSCQCDHNDGVSDSVWVTYYSNHAIKKKYRSDASRHFKASFSGSVDGKPVKVEKCGIGLVYI
ncbi:disease resistance protein RPV1-like [Vitis riparia]|uniref:disease resistance protein RPV1-like n=1 Tax=Vitis riparia TaxID=96939 RepID=UPI00155A8398|nr:disease resistance protein RPV1-like [Vitis riparia]